MPAFITTPKNVIASSMSVCLMVPFLTVPPYISVAIPLGDTHKNEKIASFSDLKDENIAVVNEPKISTETSTVSSERFSRKRKNKVPQYVNRYKFDIKERLDRCRKENAMCQICGKKFKWEAELRKHMKVYRDHSELTCKQCGVVMTGKVKLRMHEKQHAGYPLYTCPTCGKVYRYRSGLVKHMCDHTGELPYLCDICGMGFRDFFSMGWHKKQKHSTVRPFTCRECGKGFIHQVRLRHHMKVHSGDKYVCHKCGTTFGYKGNLNRHLLSHFGDKPHQCKVCGRTFARFDHVQGHAVTHRKDQNYQCAECEKVFRSDILLRRHTAIHSDENLHICTICGKRFTAPVRVKQHMVMHHEKRYKCLVCSRTFAFKRFLRGHMEKFHQISDNGTDGCC